MTWADIAAGRKPTMAMTAPASAQRSAPVAPTVPAVPETTSTRGVTNITARLASVGIAQAENSKTRTPAVGSEAPAAQNNAKKSTNHRRRRGKKSGIASTTTEIAKADSATTGVPLEEFYLFQRLPAELRFKIYRYVIGQRRVIELEWGPNMSIPTGFANGSHDSVRVCPRSRQPPALMYVCKESRDEAEKLYKLRCFDRKVAEYLPNSPEMHEHYIWYNPKADIIFFGEETCVSTYISVFGGSVEDIPAIAIVNSGKGETCCDHDDEACGVDGGVDTLQALHGFDPSETLHNSRYGGCPGLKEVFVVVKSKLWPRKHGEIDYSVTFRPATNNGLTAGQVRFKTILEQRIARVDAGIALPRVGENAWTGENKPSFKFVSFAPVAWGIDRREPDGMVISRNSLWKLRRGDWAFAKRTEAITRCEILIPEEEYKGEDPREIGFWGTRKSIDAAEKAIEERLASLNLKDRNH